jgi:hypothetical protein
LYLNVISWFQAFALKKCNLHRYVVVGTKKMDKKMSEYYNLA